MLTKRVLDSTGHDKSDYLLIPSLKYGQDPDRKFYLPSKENRESLGLRGVTSLVYLSGILMFVTISSINLSILSSRPLSRGSLRFVKNSVSVREHLEKETLLLVLFPPGGLFRPRVVHFLSTRILIERLCYSPVLTVVLPFLRRLSIFCGPQSFGVRDYFKVDTRFPSFYHLKLDIYWKETPSSWSFFFSRVPSYVC